MNKLALHQTVIDEYNGRIKLMSSEEGQNLKPSLFLSGGQAEPIPDPPVAPTPLHQSKQQVYALLSDLIAKGPVLSREHVASIVDSFEKIAKAAELYVSLNTPVSVNTPIQTPKKSGWLFV